MQKWTKEEVEFLTENYSENGKEFCATKLARPSASVAMKASRLKLKITENRKSISSGRKSPEQYLKDLEGTNYKALEPYKLSSTPIMHEHLICGHRWKASPNNVLDRLVGCPSCKRTWTSSDEEDLKEFYPGLGAVAIAEILDRSVTSVTNKAWRLGVQSEVVVDYAKIENHPTAVYLLHVPSLDLYKVGITCNIERRLASLEIDTVLLDSRFFNTRKEARVKESEILELIKPYLHNTGELKSGNTETFICPQHLTLTGIL